jgi:hypothetical protein
MRGIREDGDGAARPVDMSEPEHEDAEREQPEDVEAHASDAEPEEPDDDVEAHLFQRR